MTLRPYKFVVQAVVQELDQDGNVVAEHTTDPATVYGCAQLVEWASVFPAKLSEAKPAPPQ